LRRVGVTAWVFEPVVPSLHDTKTTKLSRHGEFRAASDAAIDVYVMTANHEGKSAVLLIEESPKPSKPPRGFAALDAETRHALARRGGMAVQAAGRAHRFTEEEAREAGRKGGAVSAARRRKPSPDES
jgi:general stress protein YciG